MHKVLKFLVIHLFGLCLAAQQTDSVSLLPLASPKDSLVLTGDKLFLVSADSIEEPVDYGASDKVRFEYAQRIIHLYGEAYIRYQSMEIKAAYIRVELNRNMAIAEPSADSTGFKTGIPEFKEGDQNFKAQKISYNFESKKGLIEEIVTKEGDLFIHGAETKFISKLSKTSGGDDIIFNQHAIITTCDAEHPHYGIYSKKQKIIPDKVAVVGPSHVQIQGIPTPLWLPFGFFPISKKARSGILFPKEYTYDDRGFGLTNIGYYLPVSDYMDLKILGDIFFKGSYKIGVISNYKKKYKYSGSVDLQYENRIQELPASYLTNINRPISLKWSHRQEAGAHPYQSFGGSVHIETKGFSKLQSTNYNAALQNVLRSSLNYNLQIPNSPFSLSAGMSHSQNLISKIVDVTLPELNFQMRSINPFQKKNRIGSTEKWYDRITTNYSAQFRNSVNTTDTILFTDKVFDDLRYGFRHGLDLNANFKILKYLSFNPSISYDEELSFFQNEIQLKDTVFLPANAVDSVYGKLDTLRKNTFGSFRTITASAGISTQVFGQILASKGWFRGIRHQLTPSISLNYSPDYHKSPFNYYKTYNTDLRPEKNTVREYIKFTDSPFGGFSVPGENFNISFNLSNRIELKYYKKKDSSFHKIPIIENLNISTNYNVFADSFNLNPIIASGSNRILNGMITIYYGMSLDPYGRDFIEGRERRSKEFAIHRNNHLLILSSAYINTTFSSTIGQFVSLFKKTETSTKNQSLPSLAELFYNFNLQYILNFRHSRSDQGKDQVERSVHSFSLQGSIPLTRNWRINLSNIAYDFNAKGFQYPSLGLERDLHCWLMRFDWSPQFGYYTFFIGVKPGSLEFIRIPSNQAFTGASR
ncbi:MAG: LPS-assembly protein LptD [Saprospiraceae bacterium]|nr:LPS-assembly protein LptD [Saprospiraceae bacterium]